MLGGGTADAPKASARRGRTADARGLGISTRTKPHPTPSAAHTAGRVPTIRGAAPFPSVDLEKAHGAEGLVCGVGNEQCHKELSCATEGLVAALDEVRPVGVAVTFG